MSRSLEEIKRQILERHQLNEIANPDRNKEINEKLAQGIRDIPINKIFQQLQYLENDLLPRLEKKSGKSSADYKFFESVGKSLCWSIILCDRYDFLQRHYTGQKIMLQMATENMGLFQRELEKFTTIEDIFLTDAIDKYVSAVKTKLEKGRKGGG